MIGKVYLFFALLLLAKAVNSMCINSTDFKYELTEVSSVSGYHFVCSEHIHRTCCSKANFQSLGKRTQRILEGQLSPSCKKLLENLVCSPCDGDMVLLARQRANKLKKEYAPASAKNSDFFSIDANNNIRACLEDDIVCSKLSDIAVTSEQACKIFDKEVNSLNCWNGEISAVLKGRIKKKTTHHKVPERKFQKKHEKAPSHTKNHTKPKQHSSKQNQKIKQSQKEDKKHEQSFFSDQVKTYFSLLGFVVLFMAGVWLRRLYKRWKRQNRHR